MQLARSADLGVEAYLSDPQAVPASRYHLLTAIEDALAVANHVIASAGFRNLLVHEYAKVDDRRVHAFLREDVKDLDRFVSAVLGEPQLELRAVEWPNAAPGRKR